MKEKSELTYEDRVTVFIDILGFKDILTETIGKRNEVNNTKVQEIIDAYRSMRDVWDLDKPDNSYKSVSKNSKEITMFSDCVVISFRIIENDEIFYTLLEIKWMIMRLIYRGVLCRGAITHGKLIHTNDFLFGPALAEAYLLESKAAIYPRVILHRDIIRLAAEHSDLHKGDTEAVESLLEKDSDGMYYIDYFGKAQEELDDPEYDFPEYIYRLGSKIRKGLMGSSSIFKSDVKVKYRWMKERYNHLIDKVQDKEFIVRVRRRGLDDVADAYESLKKINPYD